MKYCVADIVFSMKPDQITEKQAKKYIYCGDKEPEFFIKPKSIKDYEKNSYGLDFGDYQYLTCGNEFYKQVLFRNGLYLHASAVVVEGRAYLFSAPSGTGKSTHTEKWLQIFQEKAYILNDDKPIIRIFDDGIYAYGSPWSGKHDISENKKVKLQAICFLTRDIKNWIRPMNSVMSTIRLLHGSGKILSPELIEKQTKIVNIISQHIPIYEMGCTPTIEAAQIAYNIMSNCEVNQK